MRYLAAVFFTIAFCDFSCSKPTPARQLAGVWTTPFPAPLFYYSDACGNYARVAKVNIGMRWEIQRTNDDNVVEVDVFRTSTSAVQLLVPQSCALYVPMTTLINLRGDISSSQLTLRASANGPVVGSFSFTSNNLTGEFNSNFDKTCLGFCSGMGSDPKAVTLTK